MVKTLSKSVVQLTMIFGIILFAVMAITNMIVYPDWRSYRLIYLGLADNDLGFDYLFKAIISISQLMHIPYVHFRVLLMALSLVLFSYSLRNVRLKDQLGLILINFMFITCQIRQGMFIALLYIVVTNSIVLKTYITYLVATLFHSKTSLLFMSYRIYKKSPLLIKVLGAATVFYVSISFLDYSDYLPILDDYIFHFDIGVLQFRYTSLVTPILYLALFRKAPSQDKLLCLIPLAIVLYSLFYEDVLGGKIVVNSILRMLPVFLSVLVLTRKSTFGNIELILAGLILVKDIYSSQL
jgi:hypothetical protein